ncbi:60S ribosomal protein L11 [Capsicum baccatum]|uniref:60S ribosomal protein L11 n=1 Tax=Capsicum baccatum TaxID=33114 RepID=A0A2G2VZD7_CAPBA|nr:60S ribosomal protein L11 [Capsicum baccatum]
MQLPESGLMVKEYELLRKNFSEIGCFGFGIQENIDLRIKYDPSTSIYGEFPSLSSLGASFYSQLKDSELNSQLNTG